MVRSFVGPDRLEHIQTWSSDINRTQLKPIAVNCWHANEHESDAMSRLYLPGGEGVAVQSTCSLLAQALDRSPREIFLGAITYIDYETATFPHDNILYRFTHRRQSFAREREVRAAFIEGGGHEIEAGGLPVQVNLRKLCLVRGCLDGPRPATS
jgi:hypothetical protein